MRRPVDFGDGHRTRGMLVADHRHEHDGVTELQEIVERAGGCVIGHALSVPQTAAGHTCHDGALVRSPA